MNVFSKIAAVAIISATIVAAQDSDSLKAEIERLTAQLQQVEQTKTKTPDTEEVAAAETSEEAAEVAVEEVAVAQEVVRETAQIDSVNIDSAALREKQYLYSSSKKDVTVNVLRDDSTVTIVKVKTDRNDSAATIDTTIKTIRIFPKFFDGDKKNGDWNKNVIGIGGGLGMGAMYVDMEPVRHLYNQLDYASSFDNREPMFLIGGFGFGGFIDGVRAGGGGYSASGVFRSKKAGENGQDTAIVGTVNVGYGGFIIGRNWVVKRHSFYFQTMIGAGGHDVEIEKKKWSNGQLWSNDDYKKDRDFDDEEKYNSRFFALDLQTGYTKTIMPWFHIGAELSGLIMYSRNGFDADSYYSINPTAKVRFVFGSLR